MVTKEQIIKEVLNEIDLIEDEIEHSGCLYATKSEYKERIRQRILKAYKIYK